MLDVLPSLNKSKSRNIEHILRHKAASSQKARQQTLDLILAPSTLPAACELAIQQGGSGGERYTVTGVKVDKRFEDKWGSEGKQQNQKWPGDEKPKAWSGEDQGSSWGRSSWSKQDNYYYDKSEAAASSEAPAGDSAWSKWKTQKSGDAKAADGDQAGAAVHGPRSKDSAEDQAKHDQQNNDFVYAASLAEQQAAQESYQTAQAVRMAQQHTAQPPTAQQFPYHYQPPMINQPQQQWARQQAEDLFRHTNKRATKLTKLTNLVPQRVVC